MLGKTSHFDHETSKIGDNSDIEDDNKPCVICSEPGPCKCSLYLRLASRTTLFTLCAEHHQKISYTERRNRVETGLLSHGLRNSYSFLIPLQGSIISIVHLMASSSLFGAWCKFLRSSHELKKIKVNAAVLTKSL
jgi:hypothetical protein